MVTGSCKWEKLLWSHTSECEEEMEVSTETKRVSHVLIVGLCIQCKILSMVTVHSVRPATFKTVLFFLPLFSYPIPLTRKLKRNKNLKFFIIAS